MLETVAITEPMVLVPFERYEELLKEAGEKPTPKLIKEIAKARKEFSKRKTVKWKILKNELEV